MPTGPVITVAESREVSAWKYKYIYLLVSTRVACFQTFAKFLINCHYAFPSRFTNSDRRSRKYLAAPLRNWAPLTILDHCLLYRSRNLQRILSSITSISRTAVEQGKSINVDLPCMEWGCCASYIVTTSKIWRRCSRHSKWIVVHQRSGMAGWGITTFLFWCYSNATYFADIAGHRSSTGGNLPKEDRNRRPEQNKTPSIVSNCYP